MELRRASFVYNSIVQAYFTNRCDQIWVSEWNHVLWSVPSASNTKFAQTRV